MTKPPKILVLGTLLLAAAACGKKPTYHAAPAQTPGAPAQASQAAARPTEAAGTGCSSPVPDTVAIQRGIQKAMISIYGVDEAPAKFRVVQATPVDCGHVTVRYRTLSAGSAVQTSPMELGDGGKWFLTLYNKQYPVE
jgi:hypothetical protein